jgi:hypothetical protein
MFKELFARKGSGLTPRGKEALSKFNYDGDPLYDPSYSMELLIDADHYGLNEADIVLMVSTIIGYAAIPPRGVEQSDHAAASIRDYLLTGMEALIVTGNADSRFMDMFFAQLNEYSRLALEGRK